jgi:hypothetical protein
VTDREAGILESNRSNDAARREIDGDTGRARNAQVQHRLLNSLSKLKAKAVRAVMRLVANGLAKERQGKDNEHRSK